MSGLEQLAAAVGDLHSQARGSGARFSVGKPEYHQVPLWVVAPIVDAAVALEQGGDVSTLGELDVLEDLAAWQRGDNDGLDRAAAKLLLIRAQDAELAGFAPLRALDGVCAVLMYGERKYAKANWAKGMEWSVCLDCAVRHLGASLCGEELDAESGEHHNDHALTNLIFLLAYRELYPEGDDRFPEFHYLTGPGVA